MFMLFISVRMSKSRSILDSNLVIHYFRYCCTTPTALTTFATTLCSFLPITSITNLKLFTIASLSQLSSNERKIILVFRLVQIFGVNISMLSFNVPISDKVKKLS